MHRSDNEGLDEGGTGRGMFRAGILLPPQGGVKATVETMNATGVCDPFSLVDFA